MQNFASGHDRQRILVVGASGDLARPLIPALLEQGAVLGLHYHHNLSTLTEYEANERCVLLQQDLRTENDCENLIESFVAKAKGLDALVQLCGGIQEPVHWESLHEGSVNADLLINLVMPFFLVQKSMKHLKKRGGSIVLMSNAGASHGGGSDSMIYGVSKAGIERLVKGVAKDCAKDGIRVNAVAPGFIDSSFHREKMKRTEEMIRKRISLIPMNRAGSPKEVADVVLFLLSEGANYITGEVIRICGGDWL